MFRFSLKVRSDYIYYNVKEKIYHDGKKQVIVYKDNVIEKNYKRDVNINSKLIYEQLIDEDITVDEYEYKKNVSLIKSQKRTLNKIYDISRCNNWELFVTLTFNPEKVDSYDYNIVSSKLKNWFIVLRRNNKDLKYIVVPELHKSGRYHFHGLFSNCDNIKLSDSLKIDSKGNKIYNIDNYNLGFTTATKVKNSDAANKYIAKYVTKDLFKNTMYKKRYWASLNCDKPEVVKRYLDPELAIKSLDNSSGLLSKQIKEYTYVDSQGTEFTNQILFYEFK